MAYGYIGSMKTKPGCRDDVVSILLAGIDGLRMAGCHLYVVGSGHADDNTIWVSEVWASKGHHDASLQLTQAKAAISKAMSMLTGVFKPRIHGPGWAGRVARQAQRLRPARSLRRRTVGRPQAATDNRLPFGLR
jgi:quinol monooxygenase YgiN